MTSAEKVAELRQAVTAAVAGLDRDSELGEQVFEAVGLWGMLPGFARRLIVGFVGKQLPLELLEDADRLDEILGLLAGAALELHSDGGNFVDECDQARWYRAQARELLEQVRALAA